MKSNLRLDKRAKLLRLNDAVKIIQQASWDLKIITQQFPIAELNEDEYDQYINLVEDEIVNFSEAVAKLSLIINS